VCFAAAYHCAGPLQYYGIDDAIFSAHHRAAGEGMRRYGKKLLGIAAVLVAAHEIVLKRLLPR
jgi:hypothetical protein